MKYIERDNIIPKDRESYIKRDVRHDSKYVMKLVMINKYIIYRVIKK